MRAALALFLLLAPTATAWSVDIRAPASASEGQPFPIEICADGEVRILAENASTGLREDRYQPAGCRSLDVEPEGGDVRLEARVRGGTAIRARAYANITMTPAPGALRIVEARAPPLGGIVIENVGAEAAPLALRRLDGARLPNATLAPGARVFLGPRAPPDAVAHLPFDPIVRNGTLTLRVGLREESALDVPKLRAGGSTLGPYGRTDLRAERFEIEGDILAYALPGATPIPALIRSAASEVLVASHTLTSPDIVAALVDAADRGVAVRVLLEGAPPGGVPSDERALVATLQARGASVLTMGGEGARYKTMHAKLVVVDRAAIAISTENMNEGSSRGYGLVVHDAALAQRIAGVMDIDAAPWHDIHDAEFPDPPARAIPSLREPELARFPGPHQATLVLSPDDPGALARAMATARASVDVAMLRAEADGPMTRALLEAARGGARVRLLLDARFDDGVNRETAARLNAIAAREELALVAKLDRADRTLHAKMFILDGHTSYVGSMNWVSPAWSDNREAGLLVEDVALAAWLTQGFEEDWREKERANEEGTAARAEVPSPTWIALAAIVLSGSRRRAPACRARGAS